MKKILLILIILIVAITSFAENSLIQRVIESQNNFPTFSQLTQVSNINQLFDYLRDFISWKHWRFWVTVVASVFLWLAFMMIDGLFREIFSKDIQKKLSDKENWYHLYWIIFSVVLAIFFTFWYDSFYQFFADINLLSLPLEQDWLYWTLWSAFNLLVIAGIWAIVREFIVFRLVALYSIIYQVLHAITGSILAFFCATAVAYFLIGLGLVLAIIGAVVIALMVLTFIIKASDGPSSSSSSSSRDSASQKITNDSRRRAEEHKRWQEKQEKFNREQMKKSRGW